MNKELELLKTFPATSKAAWKEQVIKDLKGADFDKRLIWRTYDGIQVQPFYTAEDVEQNDSLKAQHRFLSHSKTSWTNYIEIKVEDASSANQQALKALSFDASGLLFNLGSTQPDFETLLKDIPVDQVEVSFQTATPDADVLKKYLHYCSGKGVPPTALRGFYESDILELQLTAGTAPQWTANLELVKESLPLPNFYGLVIRSHAFANGGANSSQETGFLLSKVTEYITRLTEAGLSADALWQNLLLHTAIGGDYFFELSKLRALRMLIRSIAQTYGVTDPNVKILASSGLWSKSLFDPNVNLLRNTTEGMAAILGGCDAVLIQPHDSSYKTPTDFSHRIALNISNLLRAESYLDKVADPAGGSYYIETLTGQIAEQALRLFQEVESKGGFELAFESGYMTTAIRAVRDQKEKDVAGRRQVYVGTNKYPNLLEKIAVETETVTDEANLLKPQRATQAFNLLRLKTQQHFEETGFIPKVYLACFGNLAMRKARATFSSEFFGTAGFEILGEFAFKDAATAASESATSGADIVVICSSDQEYETEAANFAQSFKAIAPDKQLVLAGYPAEIVAALQSAGVDSFIHIKTNAIEALSAFQNQLFENTSLAAKNE